MARENVGLIGLGVMGRNLALNIARHGHPVVGFDLEATRRSAAQEALADTGSRVVGSLAELAQALAPPRRVILLVPAGRAVGEVIDGLRPVLSRGDLIVDGGNSHFLDTERRQQSLAQTGIFLIGSGISGGEAGALHGPAIMPGGDRGAFDLIGPVFEAIAARTEAGPCCAYIGPRGAGHYVKMVHNGIEYGIMQLICEAYDLLSRAANSTAHELSDLFAEWNRGPLASYLIEITATVLARVDEQTGVPLVDVILDYAGQKGTGKWTSQNASDLGIAVPTIDAALHGRMLSAIKDERVAAARVLAAPERKAAPNAAELQASVRDALRLGVLATYAQGFALLAQASREYRYGLDLAEIARVWMGGCIIRARILDDIRAAHQADRELTNLLVAPAFSGLAGRLDGALRDVVHACIDSGVPAPAFSASLAYLDAYRSPRLPANLLQAQRDLFGAHTYRRVDRPRDVAFHTEW